MIDPIRATSAVRRAVAAALTDIEPGELVLVACSGGADSLALAVAAQAVGRKQTFRVGAVVVDHGLQEGSAEVAAKVARLLGELGLGPVHVVPVIVGGAGGPEAAARAARYDALTETAQASGARAVLLGHTLDDQAETVLLGLARGSGLRAIGGMAASGALFRRPLLEIGRDVSRAACDGLPVWDDPHNLDERFSRVRVRRSVLPVLESELGPGIAQALARTAAAAREAADAIDALAAAVPGELDVEVLSALPTAVRTTVIHRTAIAAGVPAGSLTNAHVRRIDALVTSWHGQGPVALPGGLAARRSYGRLGFERTDAGRDVGDKWTPQT